MKILLTLIMCSFNTNVCITPYEVPTTFNSMYDCLVKGYEMSMEKTVEIGKYEVNKHGIYIKFHCKAVPEA
jgi:hypothetical protein